MAIAARVVRLAFKLRIGLLEAEMGSLSVQRGLHSAGMGWLKHSAGMDYFNSKGFVK